MLLGYYAQSNWWTCASRMIMLMWKWVQRVRSTLVVIEALFVQECLKLSTKGCQWGLMPSVIQLTDKMAVTHTLWSWNWWLSLLCCVQQSTEPNYPEVLLIAINKFGVSLIDPASKVIVARKFLILPTLYRLLVSKARIHKCSTPLCVMVWCFFLNFSFLSRVVQLV